MALDCVTEAQQVKAEAFWVISFVTHILAQPGLLCEDDMVTPAPYLPASGPNQTEHILQVAELRFLVYPVFFVEAVVVLLKSNVVCFFNVVARQSLNHMSLV